MQPSDHRARPALDRSWAGVLSSRRSAWEGGSTTGSVQPAGLPSGAGGQVDTSITESV